MSKNIIVLGGGAAGWMTAIYAKHVYPECKVSVVASEEIGILGAGESTTPMFIDFLDIVKIPFYEFIENCGAVIKVAAKFANWNKNGEYYYNPFAADNDLAISDLNSFIDPIEQHNSRALIYSIGKHDSQNKFDFNSKLAEENKFPFSKNGVRLANFALNFDARLAADYLKRVALEQREIKYINDEVVSFDVDLEGNIKSIKCKENSVEADFVFDCSGFKRLIIGNFYNSEWKSYSKYLPTDKALPFFLSHEQVGSGVVPYISAIAMKYGWMWMTPLQHRYGCGYVFDSSYITVEEAKKEVEEYFGFEINPPKPGLFFEFNPGMYERIWINNCMAMGLSSGFIEPMEATAILSNLSSIKKLPQKIEDLLYANNEYKNSFNEKYKKEQEEILSFIYLHYITNKVDTDFWKNFVNDNEMPELLKNIIDKYNKKILTYEDFNNMDFFALENYLFVLRGNGILNEQAYIDEFNKTYSEQENLNYELFKIKQDLSLQSAISWEEMLDLIESVKNANL